MLKREPTTREEYVKEQALKNGVTPELVEEACDIVQCKCSYLGCTGWLAVPKESK